jgi:hypothetical protein
MSEGPGDFGASAGNELGRRCSSPCRRSGSTSREPERLSCRRTARPPTAQQHTHEAQADKDGKTPANADGAPIETLLGSHAGCVLRPATASGLEKRLMAAGPDGVTDTP